MNRDRVDLARVEALVGLLEDWARWQRGYRMKLGFPTRSAVVANGASTDFESMCEASDADVMGAIDAAVDDLPPAHRAAVMRRYGVAAVFRFPRDNYESCLVAAHEALLDVLPRRGVMVG